MNAESEMRSRGKAAGIHFLISFGIVATLLFACFVIWFWPPVFCATGLLGLVWLILLVDLCAGPLATFVVWKKGKKGLLFDLVVIAAIQSLFLGYGIYTVSESRPAFYVFVVDDFELVSAAAVIWPVRQVDMRLGFFSTPAYVGAKFSEDPAIRKAQQEAEMFSGISLARRPEAYVSIESRAGDLVSKARSLEQLVAYNSQNKMRDILGLYPSAAGYLPLKANAEDMTVLIDQHGKVLGMVDLRPW